MSARRVLSSLLSVAVIGSVASVGVAIAQPKKAPAKKGPVAPAKEPDPTTAPPADGAGSGSAVQPIDDPPPSDMNGTDENPDNPKGMSADSPDKPAVVLPAKKLGGYPQEYSQRPITLPQNMSEVGIAPHAVVSPYAGSDALRARYGITRQVQLGLTYLYGAVYHQAQGSTVDAGPLKFKPGKAVGLDVTVLIQDWIGVKVGVPIYIDPVATSIALGVPLKFVINDKLALGGMDDFINIKVHKFAPSYYQEAANARAAFEINNMTNTTTSNGTLRFSGYGIYQQSRELAIRADFGFELDDFSGSKNTTGHGGTQVFIRGGFLYSPRRWVDLGLSVGWDDLATAGAFAPQGHLTFRI